MTLLSASALTLYFGGLKAVDEVTFSVKHGEILAIIGPNGAGKTTLFNMISRIYPPTAGTIAFEGHELTTLSAHRLAYLGIARTFQNIELFAGTTVLANILSGCHIHRRTGLLSEMLYLPSARRQEQEFQRRCNDIAAFLGLEDVLHPEVASLPYGVRKSVELARALAVKPKLLLLDEPSSGLNVEETERMGELIIAIRRQFGTAIAMVEHDMGLVHSVSDRVIALSAGRVLAEGSPAQVSSDPDVRRAYLGDET